MQETECLLERCRGRRSVFGSVLITFVLSCPSLFAAEKNVLRITNVLGVENTVELDIINWLRTPRPELDYIAGYMYSSYSYGKRQSKFLLQVDKDMYLAVPMSAFVKAELKNNKHTVTLTNGKKVVGALIGTIRGEGKKYDLKDATNVVWHGTPKKAYTAASKKQDIWKLSTPKMHNFTCAVSDPAFVYRYYTTAGYLIGGTHDKDAFVCIEDSRQ